METRDLAWKPGPGPESLSDSEINVWRISLSRESSRAGELAALLSADELRRRDALHFERDRAAFAVSRGFLRLLLGRYTGIDPRRIRLLAGRRGKPFVDDASSAPAVEFNMSHSGDVALFALCRGRRVGVDVEKVRPDARIDDICRSFFSPREAGAILRLQGPGKIAAFYACWTRKEASVKALGESIMELAGDVIVSASAGKPARLLRVPRGHGGPRAWRLHDLPIDEGYAAAVCYEAPAGGIRLWVPD